MRKLFTTLKSVVAVAIVASMALASSCSYDDTAIKNRVDQVEQDVDKVEKDLAALTERVTALENKLKSDVEALTELINNKAVVTNLTTDADGVITVELSNGKSFKVYPECTVEDTDTDTNTYIGIKADEDGVLYFAVFEMGNFKEWLTIEDKKVPVYDGNDQCECTPVTDTNDDTYVAPYLNEEDGEYYYAVLDRMDNNKFVEWYLVNGEKVAVYDGNDDTICECKPVDIKFQVNAESGMLEFSVDGGVTWNPTGLSAADAGQQIIAGVTDNGNNTVTFTLADNSSFTVIKAALIEFNATRGHVYVRAGETKDVYFTINTAVADVNVMNQPLGWSAEVALVPADEGGEGDEVDPGMGVLAVGGTELVLKITGPSQEFINAGFAEKSGYITVHFNGNNGTCQVGKIAVDLAEITMTIDRDGNIHLENSLTESEVYGDEVWTDFAPIKIGYMTRECYDAYRAGTLDPLTESENGNMAWSEWGFSNVMDPIYYEEGVCEKQVYDFTIAEVGKMFYPQYEFIAGEQYVIFLYFDQNIDPMGYSIPDFDTALMVEYNSVLVDVAVVEGSVTWNDATLKMSFAGFTNYLVGWVSTAEVAMYIQYGMCTDLDSFYDIYLRSQYAPTGVNTMAGYIIEGVTNTEIKLSELAAIALEPYGPTVDPDTEYNLFVLPLNLASYNDLYTYTPTHADVYKFGTFKTGAMVKGTFDANAQYEIVTQNDNYLEVSVSFAEDVVTAYYEYFRESAMEEDVRVEEILTENPYAQAISATEPLNTSYYGSSYPVYLSIIAVNAAGEYVYVEKQFDAYEPEPLTEVAINSFEYMGRYKDLDDDPSTSGGGYIYLVKCADEKEYKIEVYYDYCNADGTIKVGTYDYCYNTFDAMYSSWAGFCIESSEYYYDSKLKVEDGKITLELANVASYVYNGAISGVAAQ